MRVLRLRSVRTQASLLGRFAGASLKSLLSFEIPPHENERKDDGDQEAGEIIHSCIFS